MNRLLIFLLQSLVIAFVIQETFGIDCELKARLSRAFRELPIVEKLKHRAQKPLDKIHSRRSTDIRRTGRDSIPQLAKNIESFLQKVIPNQNLVQDLMGYISMPNPSSSKRNAWKST